MLTSDKRKRLERELRSYSDWAEKTGYAYSHPGTERVAVLKCALLNGITDEEAEGMMELCHLEWTDFFYRDVKIPRHGTV